MGWLTPLVKVGYTRPLQEEGALLFTFPVRTTRSNLGSWHSDLWSLHPKHLSAFISDEVEKRFYARKAAEDLVAQTTSDPESLLPEKSKSKGDSTTPTSETAKKPEKEKVDAKLAASLNGAFFWSIWPAGVLHLIGRKIFPHTTSRATLLKHSHPFRGTSNDGSFGLKGSHQLPYAMLLELQLPSSRTHRTPNWAGHRSRIRSFHDARCVF